MLALENVCSLALQPWKKPKTYTTELVTEGGTNVRLRKVDKSKSSLKLGYMFLFPNFLSQRDLDMFKR